MMKITILGTGAYGLSLGYKAIQNQKDVTLYTPVKEEYEKLVETYQSPHLENISLPKGLKFSNDLASAVQNANIIIIATPTPYLAELLAHLKGLIQSWQIVIIGSKGVFPGNQVWMHEAFAGGLKISNYGVLAGPSFATDIVQNMPIELTLATSDDIVVNAAKEALETSSLSIEGTNDLKGVELCGILKNVLAIGAGILHGLGMTESTKAYYFQQAVNIVKCMLEKCGCQKETIFTSAGIGDMFLTLSSSHSRNYQYGVLIGSKQPKDIIAEYESKNTIEGKNGIILLNNQHLSFEHSIVHILYLIIHENEKPERLIENLYND